MSETIHLDKVDPELREIFKSILDEKTPVIPTDLTDKQDADVSLNFTEEETKRTELGNSLNLLSGTQAPDSQPKYIEVDVPPEFPGLPYSDEVEKGLILGAEYATLKRILETPGISLRQKQITSSRISKLTKDALEKGSWHFGPLNERKTKKIPNPNYKKQQPSQEQDSKDPGNAIVLYQEPKPDNGNQKDYDTDKPEPKPKAAEEPKQPEAKKSWLKTLEEKFAKTWLGKKNKDFIEYVNRHKDESKILAWLGGFAGGTSTGLGLLAAEWAVSQAYPPLGIAMSGVVVGLAFNYAFTNIFNEVYNKPKAKDELAAYNPEKHGNQQEYQEKVELDRKGRMKAFVIADIVGKVAGGIGIGLGHAFGAGESAAPVQRGDGTLGADKLGGAYDHQPNPAPGEAPLPPHPDLLSGNYVEHTVTSPNEMLTQIVRDGLPASENVYSANYVNVLRANETTFIQMLKDLYPNGNVPYLVDSTNGTWNYLTLEEAIGNLKHVVDIGDPNLLPPDQQAKAVNDMLNAIRTLKPGTIIKIPQP